MDQYTAYIKQCLPLAQMVQKKYRIPVLFALAQGALESSWGTSTPGNMFFGIKAGSSWKGKVQKLLTTEILTAEQFKALKSVHSVTQTESGKYKVKVYEPFRAYSSPAESWDDYGKLLSENSRYAKAFEKTDPVSFAREIAAAKYATAENYFEALVQTMETLKKKLPEGAIKAAEISGGLILLAGMAYGIMQKLNKH